MAQQSLRGSPPQGYSTPSGRKTSKSVDSDDNNEVAKSVDSANESKDSDCLSVEGGGGSDFDNDQPHNSPVREHHSPSQSPISRQRSPTTVRQSSDRRPRSPVRKSATERQRASKRPRSPSKGHKKSNKRRDKFNYDSESSSDSSSSSSSSCSSSSSSSSASSFKLSESDKEWKIPKAMAKFVMKHAADGMSKKHRQDLMNDFPLPKLSGIPIKKTDRFVRKLFAINTNSKWNGKREREHINAQARIADALGPLLKLWSASQNVLKSKQGQGVDPNDVILYLKAAVSLIGNAFFVFLKERRKSLLFKILPDCVDMLEDKKSRKVLKKSREFLFGRKFKKLLARESSEYKELKSLISTSRFRGSRGTGGQRGTYRGRGGQYQRRPGRSRPGYGQFFRQGPSDVQQSGGRYNFRGGRSARGQQKTQF